MEKYFKILDLEFSENISIDDIKKAFRKKAKKIHPDYNKSKNADEEFRILYEAYEILINEYDKNKNKNKKNNNNNFKNFSFLSKIFSPDMAYWLKVIFGDDMPSFIQNGYEPTGIFGPPYK